MLNNIAALLDSGVTAAATDYESIQTYTVGAGGSASITFSSIPSTYSHLQIRYFARGTRSATRDTMYFYFNSDTTGSNYYFHILSGDGATASAQASAGFTNYVAATGLIAAASATSGVFGGGVIDVLDYSKTTKNKTVRSLTGIDGNGNGATGLYSALWNSTAAITGITLRPDTGNFDQYSSFALYGIK